MRRESLKGALFISITALVAVVALAGGKQLAASASQDAGPAKALANKVADVPSGPGLYIVQLHEPPLPSYTGGIAGLEATSPRATGARRLDPKAPASQAYRAHLEARHGAVLQAVRTRLDRNVEPAFRYTAALNGFAVNLSPAEAAAVAKLPGVKAVTRDMERTLDTDVGPIHIGAPSIWNGSTGTGTATRGEGIIIGIIDSGINSQHPSFADADGDGYVHTNPYGAGVYKGWCVANPGFCNSKLIGAYTFHPNGGSPEDTNGHGSHTTSTAGGNKHTASFTVGADPYAIEIQGVAPRANIVAYKVCDPSCPTTASIAAVNSAILEDQVNVLNYSISGVDNPWVDLVDQAFLNASNAGIFVAASAGNTGPGSGTVAKTGPWNAAVAASTINRIIAHTLDVTGPTTPPALQGLAAVPGEGTAIVADINGPIRFDQTNVEGCSAFPAGFFAGALALIQRGTCTFATKVTNAAAAGATGVVVFQNVGGPPITMGSLTGTPPAVMLDLAGGTGLRDYIIANPAATVRINAATSYLVDNAWQDVVAGFSARGPSQFEFLKPDFTAPGVNILAAVAATGGNPAQYGFQQGTSMSSPHAAGAGALIMALHPTWSPAQIRSALASTATGGLVKEDGATPADPFDVGSGLLALGGAGRVGLVLDETGANYAAADPALGGDPKTLNQPSMVDYACPGTCSWTRTVASVLPVTATYTASFSGPPGMVVTVTPSAFTIPAGGTQILHIQADVSPLPLAWSHFGTVTLTTGAEWPAAPPVAVTPSSLPVVVRNTLTYPAISLTKTVGTVPGVCAATDTITVPAGTEVYYCYQVENTGNVALDTHDLTDSELGVLLSDFAYALAPGAFSPEVIVPATPMVTVTNTGTWTARTGAGDYTYDDTAPFSYLPINATGTPLNLTDDGEANITLPFPLTFYGVTSSNLRVGNNGGILFDATTGDVGFGNSALPSASHPLAIFPFWDDLDDEQGNVYWEVQGAAPNRVAIIEWYQRPHFPGSAAAETVTFQALLYEGSNQIKFQYLDVDLGDPLLNNGASATVGLNKDATTAVQYSFNQPVIQNNMAILFEPSALSAQSTDTATVTVQQQIAIVTVLVGAGGGGSVSGGGPYSIGDTAVVTATPDSGWVFLHWLVDDGPGQVATNPYSFEVTGDVRLTAIFQRQAVEPIPTTGTVGLILLLGLLLGSGVFVLRRMA